MAVIILPMHEDDIHAVSVIHSTELTKQNDSQLWVKCNFSAYPRVMIFVARDEKDHVIGYIQWIHKEGFAKLAVLELEQVVVAKNCQRQGIATQLVNESLQCVKESLVDNGCQLKTVIAPVYTGGFVARFYKKALDTNVVCINSEIKDRDVVLVVKNIL